MVAGSGDGVQWLKRLGLGSESSGGGGSDGVAVQGRAGLDGGAGATVAQGTGC